MKTEPTEAKKYLINKEWITPCFEDGFESEQYVISDHIAEVAINIAFREGQSNPKIKQLEWKEISNETLWYCDLPIGFYIIEEVRKYKPHRVRFYLSEYDLPKYERFCKTIEEALMYAQKDFEARVKECLTTE